MSESPPWSLLLGGDDQYYQRIKFLFQNFPSDAQSVSGAEAEMSAELTEDGTWGR